MGSIRNRDVFRATILIPIGILLLFAVYHFFVGTYLSEIRRQGNAASLLTSYGYDQYSEGYLPSGYKKGETVISGAKSNYFFTKYRGKNNWFILAQYQKPRQLNLTPPTCSIYGSSNDNFELFYSSSSSSGISGDCKVISSTEGREVYIMQNPLSQSPRNYAVVVIKNTLISIDGYNFSQEELIKIVDGLEIKK